MRRLRQACRSGIRENSKQLEADGIFMNSATRTPVLTLPASGEGGPCQPFRDRFPFHGMDFNPHAFISRGLKPALRIVIAAVVLCGIAGGIANLQTADAAGKAKFNKVLNIGDKAPDWTDFPGIDGKTHSLGEYRDAKAIVLVFTCNHCPVAKQYEERLMQFAKAHEKRVQVVAISVSHNGADRLDKMKARAAEKRFPFPYLYDESQKSARAYGATVTPHFFVLDADRKIAYMGAFDDNIFEPEKVEKHYLVDAVEAVLAGNEPKVKESLQRGCAIDYE